MNFKQLPHEKMYIAYMGYYQGDIASFADDNNLTIEEAGYVISRGRRASERRAHK